MKFIKENGRNKWNKKLGLYECKCGKQFTTIISQVKNDYVKSCGCLRIENAIIASTVHGQARRSGYSSERTAWANMKARCYNKNSEFYYLYGAKGITVSNEWKDSFEQFFVDMGKKPGKGYSIERIDGTKGYSKNNCKWATAIEQANNVSTNIHITYNGETKTIAQWARTLSLSASILYSRRKRGWTDEKIITTKYQY